MTVTADPSATHHDCRCPGRGEEEAEEAAEMATASPVPACDNSSGSAASSSRRTPSSSSGLTSSPPPPTHADAKQRRLTHYERVSEELASSKDVQKEVTLGKRIGFYRLGVSLGVGNFSQVKLATHVLTKERVAIKILDKTKLDAKTQRLLSREISSMERVHHPHIIRLYEVLETLVKLHIVMEYAPGGELFTKITTEGRIPENEAQVLFAQIVSAVGHMHDQHIIHRDLKAENVFFTGPHTVKVGDFGFSTFARPDQHLTTFCGSPPYAAPELFKDDYYLGPLVDVWALGILLYFMVTGFMPFRADTVGKLKRLILAGDYSIPRRSVTEPCKELIRNLLRHLPAERWSIDEIRTCEWMMSPNFPSAMDRYELNPRSSNDHSLLGEDEVVAQRLLRDLGITGEHIARAQGRCARSSITGTYRIVLHKIHKKENGELNGELKAVNSALSVRSCETPLPPGERRMRQEKARAAASKTTGGPSNENSEGSTTSGRVSKMCALL